MEGTVLPDSSSSLGVPPNGEPVAVGEPPVGTTTAMSMGDLQGVIASLVTSQQGLMLAMQAQTDTHARRQLAETRAQNEFFFNLQQERIAALEMENSSHSAERRPAE